MKLNKISLQNLSQAEMAKKEQNLLRGGNGDYELCPCISMCLCTGYATPESDYYEGSNMISLDSKELMPVAVSNNKTGYSY